MNIVERTKDGELLRPEFKSDVPEFLLRKCTPAERWQCEQASISRQQNEWLISVALAVDKQLIISDKELAKLQKLRLILAGKWSVLAWIVVAILVPSGLITLSIWLEHLFVKKP